MNRFIRIINSIAWYTSSVYNLFFSGQMKSLISEANSHPPVGGFISVCDFTTMAISSIHSVNTDPLVGGQVGTGSPKGRLFASTN